MTRFAFALVFSFAVVAGVRAADLPAGTWSVNVDGKKGELVIAAVAKDGKVTAKLLGEDVVGKWNGETLTFQADNFRAVFEAYLVSEPAEKGKTKYTLTGTRKRVALASTAGNLSETKSGWYAQITADTPVPVGAIKAEIRGVLIQDGAKTYVSVKHKDVFGAIEETRIWIWASEGEWKVLKLTLAPLYDKEVIVTGMLAQLPKGHMTSIPEGALYFLGRFDIERAGILKEPEPKKE